MKKGKMQSIQNLISRRHPAYTANKDHWDFLFATYRGGRAWFEKNIFKYHKEGNDEFKSRLERAYRFNHTREVVDLVDKYLWRSTELSRSEDAPDSVKRFWRRCKRNGWAIEKVMPSISRLTSIWGRVWIVVDSSATSAQEIRTKADEKQLDYRTFFHAVRPQDLLDVGYDDDGAIIWATIAENIRDDDDPMTEGKTYPHVRLWTKTGWHLYAVGETTGKGQRLVDEGTHDLGICPVFPADNRISDELYTSQSLIEDIAYLDRAIANYLSNLDAIIQDQTFSQLAMPAQSSLFQELAGDDDKEGESHAMKRMQEVGTRRVFLYDAEGGQPMFLSPDPKQAQLITQVIQQIINEIYHCVGVAGERTKADNSMGIDNSSGVAKAFDFERVNSLLVSKGQSLEWIENRLVEMVLRWHGEWDDKYIQEPLVQYPRTYDVVGLHDELDLSARLEMLTTPLKLRQYQLKRAVKKMYQGAKSAEITALLTSIDEMEDAINALEKTDLGKSFNKALPNQQNQEQNQDSNDGREIGKTTDRQENAE